jgi:hypothetical protein
MISSRTPGGNSAMASARFSLTESITSMVLAPIWPRTSRTTVGTPLSRARLRCSLVPSSARPMSRMRSGTPSTVRMTRLLNSSGSVMRPAVRRMRSLSPAVTLPPGASWFWRARAACTSLIGSL